MGTPIQGFLASLSIDGLDITQEVMSVPLGRSKSVLNKSVMDNTGASQSIPGMESGTLSIDGFLSSVEHNALEVTWAKDVAVAFVLTADEGGSTDPSWAGFVTLSSFTVEPREDGVWQFSLSGDLSGPVVYTPAAP